MSDERYDIQWHQHGPDIVPHFCRELNCFGTNPDHGYTLDEAVLQIVQWHLHEVQALLSKEHRVFEML